MNRLLIGVGAALAAVLVAAPATLALSGNTSFSRDIPVPVPSGAHQVHFADRSGTSSSPESRAATTSGHRRGDDSGHPEDRPRSGGAASTAPDDHGGLRSDAGSRAAEPGDDSGRSRGDGAGDDSGRDSGHDSGDDGGHAGGSGGHGGRG